MKYSVVNSTMKGKSSLLAVRITIAIYGKTNLCNECCIDIYRLIDGDIFDYSEKSI